MGKIIWKQDIDYVTQESFFKYSIILEGDIVLILEHGIGLNISYSQLFIN